MMFRYFESFAIRHSCQTRFYRKSAFILITIFMLISGGISSAAAVDWPHYGYDPGYTSYNPLESTIDANNISQLQRKWGIGCDDTGSSVMSPSPALHQGNLYVSGVGRKLTAYNAQTGQKLWDFGYGDAGWAPQPAVSKDGIIFYLQGIFANNSYLYAVSPNGSELWESSIGFMEPSHNAVNVVTVDDEKGVVYITQNGEGWGEVFALDKQTGQIIWSIGSRTDNRIGGIISDYVTLREGEIFVSMGIKNGYSVGRIDLSNHNLDIIFDRPAFFGGLIMEHGRGNPVLCNDKLIATWHYLYNDIDGTILAAYNVNASPIIWQKNIPYPIMGNIACNTTKNIIYVPTGSYLYALDATTGQEIWHYTGSDAIYNPSIANGLVYFISDTNMYAVDETTGQRIFHYPLGHKGDEKSQVAIANGMLFFSGNGGTCDLFALGFTNLLTLTVTKTGSGTVSSQPAGIDCGTDCSASYTNGTPVTLTPTPDNGSRFVGWSGACSGTGTCQVTMDQARTVTATFNPTYRTEAMVVDFGQYGIWLHSSDQHWVQVHPLTAAQLVATALDGNNQTDLVVNFGNLNGTWVWMNNQNWLKLHDLAPVSITAADVDGNGRNDLVVNFGAPYGLWLWMNNQTWVKLHSLAPVSITAADLDGNGQTDLVVNFGNPYGLWTWMNNQSWTQLHALSPALVTTARLDDNAQQDLVIDFKPYGIWKWMNNQTWVKLHDLPARSITAADLDGNGQDEVVIDFNPYGLWVWTNNQSWTKLHPLSPASVTAAYLDDNVQQDLIIDFAPYGIWLWMNNQNWMKLHDLPAKHIIVLPE